MTVSPPRETPEDNRRLTDQWPKERITNAGSRRFLFPRWHSSVTVFAQSVTRQMQSVQIDGLRRIRWRVSYNISADPVPRAQKSRKVCERCLCVPLLSVGWPNIAAGAFGYPVHPIRAPIPCLFNDAEENSAAIWWGCLPPFDWVESVREDGGRGEVDGAQKRCGLVVFTFFSLIMIW